MRNRRASDAPAYYIAVTLYESSSPAQNYLPLYEECFVLIQATSLEEAEEKALVHAKNAEARFQNEEGEEITWLLKHIVDVSPAATEEFKDGVDLYVRHFRDYEAYKTFEPLLSEQDL